MGVALYPMSPREAVSIADSLGTLELVSLAIVLQSPWKDLLSSDC